MKAKPLPLRNEDNDFELGVTSPPALRNVKFNLDAGSSSPPAPLRNEDNGYDLEISSGEGGVNSIIFETILRNENYELDAGSTSPQASLWNIYDDFELGNTSPPAPLWNVDNEFELKTSSGEGRDILSKVEEPLITYARELRKNQTRAEELLWGLLRNRQFHGLKFRRQHPVKPSFILDFYCLEKKLAIELDGIHHEEPGQKKYDEYRAGLLSFIGIKIIRFKNHEVLNDIEKVLKQISSSCFPPSPHQE